MLSLVCTGSRYKLCTVYNTVRVCICRSIIGNGHAPSAVKFLFVVLFVDGVK